ncbi:MAG: Crp/Fnr family transcriptional regulator [Bacteroidota bacterium]
MLTPLISYLQLFRPIPEADGQHIAAAFKHRVLKEGDTLFNGGICRERYFICRGILRIMVNTEDGRQVTHYFLKENQFCTILNSFNEQVPTGELIQAACDAEVLVTTRDRLLALYDQVPYLKALMDQIIQQALLDKIRIRNAYLGHDATAQYKLFLIQQPDIATRVPISDIASYLGITPQSLSRIRKNIR